MALPKRGADLRRAGNFWKLTRQREERRWTGPGPGAAIWLSGLDRTGPAGHRDLLWRFMFFLEPQLLQGHCSWQHLPTVPLLPASPKSGPRTGPPERRSVRDTVGGAEEGAPHCAPSCPASAGSPDSMLPHRPPVLPVPRPWPRTVP